MNTAAMPTIEEARAIYAAALPWVEFTNDQLEKRISEARMWAERDKTNVEHELCEMALRDAADAEAESMAAADRAFLETECLGGDL